MLLAGEEVRKDTFSPFAFSPIAQRVLLVLLEKPFYQLIVLSIIADEAHGKLSYMLTALVPAQDVHHVQTTSQAFPIEGISVLDLFRCHAGLFLLVMLI